MAPATGTALLLLAAFVLPGFVSILVKERIYEVPAEQHAFDRLLQTLYYSALVYAVPVGVAVLAGAGRADFRRLFRGQADPRLTAGIAITAALVLPTVVAYGGRRWMVSRVREPFLRWLKVSITHRTPSSWDYGWEDGEPCLVVATLKNGDVVGGYYGPLSHSGYGSQYRDLFLEELWHVAQDTSGMRLEPVERSLGVWLAADEIVRVERYGVSDEQVEEIRK
jgi:uncharacterized protein DUF6338